MKGLHISDLHLDRPYTGIKNNIPKLNKILTQSDQMLFDNLLSTIIEHQIELVLISGDTFHDEKLKQDTYEKWENFLYELQKLSVEVFLICGNHDPYGNFHQERYPSNVHLYVEEEVTTKYFQNNKQEVAAISSFSYNHPYIYQDKSVEMPKKFSNVDYHLGMYHGQASGGKYAPFNLSILQNLGYDYLALGHYHQLKFLTDNIVYAGTLLPKKVNEQASGYGLIFELNTNYCHVDPIKISKIGYQIININDIDKLEDYLHFEMNSYLENSINLITLNIAKHLVTENVYHIIDQYNRQATKTFVINVVLQDTNNNYHNFLDQDLESELIYNYQKLEIYQELLNNLPSTLHDHELIKDMVEHKKEIIDRAMLEFKDDLKGI